MTFNPDDDVWIEFDGEEHPGVVLKVEGHGWIRCEMMTDPAMDYGSGTERLAPVQTVAVHSGKLRLRDASD